MAPDRYSRRFYRRPPFRQIALLTLLGAAAGAVVIGTLIAIFEVLR